MIDEFSLTKIIIFILAVWRMTSLLVDEDGPFLIFLRLRLLIGMKCFDQFGEMMTGEDVIEQAKSAQPLVISGRYFSNELAKLFSCIWCTGFWVALTTMLLHELLKNWQADLFEFALLVLAFNAGAIIVESFTTREE